MGWYFGFSFVEPLPWTAYGPRMQAILAGHRRRR
jgi:hypothetical protein